MLMITNMGALQVFKVISDKFNVTGFSNRENQTLK